MMNGPEKLRLPTVDGTVLEAQVNWTQEAVGKFIKLKIGDQEAIVPREQFVRAALLFGNEQEQERLLPTKHVSIRHLKKHYKLRMVKEMKPGDMLEFTATFDVPLSDAAAEFLRRAQK